MVMLCNGDSFRLPRNTTHCKSKRALSAALRSTPPSGGSEGPVVKSGLPIVLVIVTVPPAVSDYDYDDEDGCQDEHASIGPKPPAYVNVNATPPFPAIPRASSVP